MKAMKMVAIKICKPIWVSLIGTDEWRQQRVKETENIGVCLSSKDLVGHQGKEQSLWREKTKLMKELRNVPGFVVNGGFSGG